MHATALLLPLLYGACAAWTLPRDVAHPVRALPLHAAATPAAEADDSLTDLEDDGRTPITMLSGFLGAGKTTVLKNLLENKEGLRIALIVNDVADVNIDAKLVKDRPLRGKADPMDMIELENGCACCSLADELFASLAQLHQMATLRGFEYDHYVIEASGVGEPRRVRETFQDAEDVGFAIMQHLRLDTMVTVVDAQSFVDYYSCSDRVEDRSELGSIDPAAPPEDAMPYQRAVVDLLVEQIETADVVVLNKIDLATEERVRLSTDVLKTINPGAKVLRSSYGALPLSDYLGVAGGLAAANRGSVDDHKEAVRSAEESAAADAHEEGHSHAHEHAADAGDCGAASCGEAAGHSHSHSHAGEEGAEGGCSDPGCTDPTHSHDHSHSHSHSHGSSDDTTAKQRFGLESKVFRSRRPFHPERLLGVLACLQGGRAVLKVLEGEAAEAAQTLDGDLGERDERVVEAVSGIMRSKGFLWLANSDSVAYYWSHAGQFAEVSIMGRWWASVPRDRWPEGFEDTILEDFEAEDSPTGDRRQELVVIGTGWDGGGMTMLDALETALLTDEELDEYNAICAAAAGDEASMLEQLKARFPSPF